MEFFLQLLDDLWAIGALSVFFLCLAVLGWCLWRLKSLASMVTPSASLGPSPLPSTETPTSEAPVSPVVLSSEASPSSSPSSESSAVSGVAPTEPLAVYPIGGVIDKSHGPSEDSMTELAKRVTALEKGGTAFAQDPARVLKRLDDLEKEVVKMRVFMADLMVPDSEVQALSEKVAALQKMLETLSAEPGGARL